MPCRRQTGTSRDGREGSMRNMSVPTRTYRRGFTSTVRATGRVRLIAYAIAFGLGLAFSFMLVRDTTHRPAPQGRVLQPISRVAVASPPSSTTAVRHPVSPPVG